MCVAPFLGPSRAVCLGAVYRKWKVVGKGLAKQILGLLAIGSTLAFLVTGAFFRLAPEIIITPEIMIRTFPTLKDIYLASLISFASGLASSFALVGSLELISESYQERPRARRIHYPRLFDVTLGVEIAISLIPPASVVGIGLAFGRFDIFLHSLALLMINVWGLNAGSIVVLSLWGVEPTALELEMKVRKTIEKTISAVAKVDSIRSGIILHSYDKADVYIRLYTRGNPDYEEPLPARVSKEIKEETGVSSNVRIIVYPVHIHTS